MNNSTRRWFVSELLGRPLKPNEEIHHLDGNHNNDDILNLSIVSPSQHAKLHQILERHLAPNHPLSQEVRKIPYKLSDLIMHRIALDISC